MKKLLILLLTFVLVFGLISCANGSNDASPNPSSETAPADEPDTPDESDTTDEPTPATDYDSADDPPPSLALPEEEEEDEVEVVAENSNITGALTRIEYGDNVVYLFGTIHAYREGWTPLATVVEDAIDRADVFFAEMSGEEMTNMEALVPEVMFLPDGQTWVEFLPAEAYEHFVELMEIWDIPYEEVNTWHPSFLTLFLSLQVSNSFAPDVAMGAESIDAYVIRRAAERGLPTLGLESAAQQVEILYTPPFEVIVAQVMAFGTPDEVAEEILYVGTMADMAKWYEANDFQAFRDQFVRQFRDISEERHDLLHMREMLINFRSTYYANRIADLLHNTEEPTTFFIAVGISHVVRAMGGTEGLTDIVEQLGFMGFVAEPLWR